MKSRRRYRCPVCGRVLPAWLPAAKRPNGAMLLGHLSTMHPDQVRPYLARMRTEDIETVVVKAYEVAEENETQ